MSFVIAGNALRSTVGRISVLIGSSSRWKSTTRCINKVLIANRGEIACRIIRTSKRLGIRTVAVYSDADRNSLHVSMADEAYNIGPAAVSQSYLRGDVILGVVKATGCQAVHPGYGFLSENVEFAVECQNHDVVFIGPPPDAIRDMGIKSTSKEIMSVAGVPIIDGYHGEDQSDSKLGAEAARIGYPIMIKAVRGGGGKGMRIAMSEADFSEALDSAKREAQKAFGDQIVLLERFVAEPRHVEVQVFADTHGNVVHLYERDCSVQRRYQKVIEEAPAPGLSDDLRAELGAAAVRAAKAVGYVGAGTVEFVLDRHSHSFHFMEMNTRLQVEHPITEMITNTDLVEWQLKIAAGERLPVQQADIPLNGHAFEARIYAEDPRAGFLPGAGPLLHLSTPQASKDCRIETGVQQGDQVSVHYDPMIAKLVVWGKDRAEALLKLQSHLVEYNIAGLETNVNFLIDLTRHPEFMAGNVYTNFIRDHNDALFCPKDLDRKTAIQAALAMVLLDEEQEIRDAVEENNHFHPFLVEAGFRVNYHLTKNIKLKYNDEELIIKVKFCDSNEYMISMDDGQNWIRVTGELQTCGNKTNLSANIDGDISRVNLYRNEEFLAIFNDEGKTQFALEQHNFDEVEQTTDIRNRAVAPMPGVLDKILVKAGDVVKRGDSLFVIIAMKMEYVVKASADGVVDAILFNIGDNVPKDAIIVKFQDKDK